MFFALLRRAVTALAGVGCLLLAADLVAQRWGTSVSSRIALADRLALRWPVEASMGTHASWAATTVLLAVAGGMLLAAALHVQRHVQAFRLFERKLSSGGTTVVYLSRRALQDLVERVAYRHEDVRACRVEPSMGRDGAFRLRVDVWVAPHTPCATVAAVLDQEIRDTVRACTGREVGSLEIVANPESLKGGTT